MGTTVAITLASGDADLFVSFETTQPTKEKHTWAAAGRTDCQLVDCGNTIQGGDAIHIPAKDARLCRDANGLYTFPCFAFIGVYGSEASVFTISQTFADDERPVVFHRRGRFRFGQPPTPPPRTSAVTAGRAPRVSMRFGGSRGILSRRRHAWPHRVDGRCELVGRWGLGFGRRVL